MWYAGTPGGRVWSTKWPSQSTGHENTVQNAWFFSVGLPLTALNARHLGPSWRRSLMNGLTC